MQELIVYTYTCGFIDLNFLSLCPRLNKRGTLYPFLFFFGGGGHFSFHFLCVTIPNDSTVPGTSVYRTIYVKHMLFSNKNNINGEGGGEVNNHLDSKQKFTRHPR